MTTTALLAPMVRAVAGATALCSACFVFAGYEDGVSALERDDYRSAQLEFEPLAGRGDARAQYQLGWMHETGRGFPKSSRRAVDWYRGAAAKGHAEAQYRLASMYMFDWNDEIARDARAAVAWYRKAAESGHAEAQWWTGTFFRNGSHGVRKDMGEAARWFRKSAEQENETAQDALGSMYAEGIGVPKDEMLALRWHQRAFENVKRRAERPYSTSEFGWALPKMILADRYSSGLGTPKDEAKAAAIYLGLARDGNAAAAERIAERYSTGIGVPKDDQQAAYWNHRLANQGWQESQTRLGMLYLSGVGVEKDSQVAYFWFLLAAASGDKVAIEHRDAVERALPRELREEAQAAARTWRPKLSGIAAAPPTAKQPVPPPNKNAQHQSRFTGSGFRVGLDLFITNEHVVRQCIRLEIAGLGVVVVRASDPVNDLALLVGSTPSDAWTIASVRRTNAKIGEPVMVAGYPLQGVLDGFTATTGIVSNLTGIGGDAKHLQLTAPVQPGNSGGPLLDGSGLVIGVVASKLNAVKIAQVTGDIPQNVNFAVSGDMLRAFLAGQNVGGATADEATGRLPSTTMAVAASARRFTVLVECWR